MHRFFTFSVCVAGLVCLGSCEKEEASSRLLDTRWMLVQVEETPISLSSYSGTYRSYIQFSSQNKTSGLGPCNSFSGTFSQGSAARQLTISQQASTRAACGAMMWEDKYFNALPRTARYEISGKELRLYDATNSVQPLLVFENRD
jgi:heat shock protein HslJ